MRYDATGKSDSEIRKDLKAMGLSEHDEETIFELTKKLQDESKKLKSQEAQVVKRNNRRIKMVTHFDPYIDTEDGPPEVAPCGTRLGEKASLDWRWKNITCKRCLKQRDRLDKSFQETEKYIIEQMGDMAEFFKTEEAQNETKNKRN